jgi:hypothetical protein
MKNEKPYAPTIQGTILPVCCAIQFLTASTPFIDSKHASPRQMYVVTSGPPDFPFKSGKKV